MSEEGLVYTIEENCVGCNNCIRHCPAIVNYIKKYKQSILPQLIPVQSPLICAAIYYKDYIGCKEEFAFISQCIAKKSEIDSEETKNYVKYNVTIEKLVKYIEENNIDLDSYVEEDIKEKNAFGFLYSRPGGLKENVQQIYPDFWIRQVEGQEIVYEYLNIYEKRSKLDKQLPSLVDALNCEFGCNVGTGMPKEHLEVDDIDAKFNNEKKLKKSSNIIKLHKAYNKNLKLKDFIREYKLDKKMDELKVDDMDKERIFNELLKPNYEDRAVNC